MESSIETEAKRLKNIGESASSVSTQSTGFPSRAATTVPSAHGDIFSRRKPSPTQPYGPGPPSPAVQERALRLYLSRPLARIAAEGAERSEAGEGFTVPGVRLALTATSGLHLAGKPSHGAADQAKLRPAN